MLSLFHPSLVLRGPGLGLLFVCCALIGCGRAEFRPTVEEATPGDPPPLAHKHGLAIQLSADNTAFEVTGLSAEALAELARVKRTPEAWASLLSVHVSSTSGDQPPMVGAWRVDGAVLRFEPRFPIVPGVRYQAKLDPSRLPGRSLAKQEPILTVITLAKPQVAPAVVQQVYPTSGTLPENQLKFYIHFSASMSRGEAYDHIKLLDANGKPIEAAFLELGEELWDPAQKRFTLLIDPGRIKQGLKPRADLGPVLENGKSYTLVIDNKWPDANSNPLKESYRKSFKVGPPFDKPVDPKTWKLQAPPAGKTEPLTVAFPVPLDHALLLREVWVTDADGKRVVGTLKVTDNETRWHFTPAAPWKAGSYRLVAKTTLEDLAGNKIGQLFEVDVFQPIQKEIKAETVELAFQVEGQ